MGGFLYIAHKKEDMTKGILLLATTYHQYGQMAVALAATIKRHWPDIQIALACDQMGIKSIGAGIDFFDHVIDVEPKTFKVRGKESPHRVKLFLDQLTPFDRTLYLDADSMVWPEADLNAIFDQPEALKIQLEYFTDIANPVAKSQMKPASPGRLYNGLKGIKGGTSTTIWFDDYDVVSEYNLTDGHIPSYNASFMLWSKKDKHVKAFWEKAREIYDNPHPNIKWTGFAGDMPDEYAFDIASILLGIKFDYPRYWPLLHDKPKGVYGMRDMAQMSIGFTMYGPNYNNTNSSFVGTYDNMNIANAMWWRDKGRVYIPYRFVNKSKWNTLRNSY